MGDSPTVQEYSNPHLFLSRNFSTSNFNSKKKLHEVLPKYDVTNVVWETNSDSARDFGGLEEMSSVAVLSGPDQSESEQSFSNLACARAISTYPHPPTKQVRDGDPICDQFCLRLFRNRAIFAVADGCNWGNKAREAASRACSTFSKYMNKHHERVTNTQEAGIVCLEALSEANKSIVEGKKDILEGGTTTLLGGIMLELKTPNPPINGQNHNRPGGASDSPPTSSLLPNIPQGWCVVIVSVGDCKAYHFHRRTRRVTEITAGNRQASARDPGGRLGPCSENGLPDLRNLRLDYWPCEEGDLLFVVSDGVYDNLDPQQMGFDPKSIGLSEGITWKEVDADESQVRKLHWTLRYLQEQFFCIEPVQAISAKWLCRKLLQHSRDLTQKCREYMESHPSAAQPKNYREFPGKMDHTTCLVFRVGNFLSAHPTDETEEERILLSTTTDPSSSPSASHLHNPPKPFSQPSSTSSSTSPLSFLATPSANDSKPD